MYGTVAPATSSSDAALIAETQPSSDDPRAPVYVATGLVESSQDFGKDTG
jgi:hypothetical protein